MCGRRLRAASELESNGRKKVDHHHQRNKLKAGCSRCCTDTCQPGSALNRVYMSPHPLRLRGLRGGGGMETEESEVVDDFKDTVAQTLQDSFPYELRVVITA